MKQQNLAESFNSAINGFIHVFKTQRNMRLHFLMGLFALLLGVFLNFTSTEFIILCITIAFVLFSEMFNTAFEDIVDLVHKDFHPLAKTIKDVMAGAVLLSALVALIVGYILFVAKAGVRIEDSITKIKESSWHITFIILIIILAMVILSKILLHSGTPSRGGMPSGHSAIAFSIWTIIALLYPNSLVIFLVFILAFLVARSRISKEIHSILEVAIGAFLGVSLTLTIFQFLRK